MYGFGLIKAFSVTLKNLLIPSRMFTHHQYPDRKLGPLDLAKQADKNILLYVIQNPKTIIKSLLCLLYTSPSPRDS